MPSTLRDKAVAIAAKKHRIKDPLLIDSAEARDTESGKPIHRFKVVAATHANGSALSLFLSLLGGFDRSRRPCAETKRFRCD